MKYLLKQIKPYLDFYIEVASFVVEFSSEAFPLVLAISDLASEKALPGVFLIEGVILRTKCSLAVSVVILQLKKVTYSIVLLVFSHQS